MPNRFISIINVSVFNIVDILSIVSLQIYNDAMLKYLIWQSTGYYPKIVIEMNWVDFSSG